MRILVRFALNISSIMLGVLLISLGVFALFPETAAGGKLPVIIGFIIGVVVGFIWFPAVILLLIILIFLFVQKALGFTEVKRELTSLLISTILVILVITASKFAAMAVV